MPENHTARQFIIDLKKEQSNDELVKYQRYFKFDKDQQDISDYFIGVKMGIVFKLAKDYVAMNLDQLEQLLESPIHEARVGAVSIMDWQVRSKKTGDERRQELFKLYLRRHDRINNWDIVDRSAPRVIGGYLFDKSRDILIRLANSDNEWERRTAIVSTGYFIKQGQLADTFKIASILFNDSSELVLKATGWMLRAAGDVSQSKLVDFLNQQIEEISPVLLSYSMQHLDKEQKQKLRQLKRK